MAGSPTLLPESRLGSTLRRDSWWVELLPVIILLGGFGLYATLRAFEGAFYEWGPYLSPFYSPLIDPGHHWWPWSPALLILGGPLGFRATCYYYRKAYYRAFFLDPPSCAVGEPAKRKYQGETRFPFILQNLHRYFFYIAVVFLAFLWYDAVVAYDWNGHFGIGVGSLIMSVNIIMLTLYTFSCHSLRHLAGGKLDCFSCASFGKPRYDAWRGVSFLNERHMQLAWTSLITVGLTDFYIRMVACGAIHDLRIL
ncbi:MAG: hypothetical protein WBG02_14970 [Candidatus Acidiferrum sp.]